MKFRGILTDKECDALIKFTETAGYEKALVNVGGGRQKYIPDYRNSYRLMMDNKVLTDAIYQKIKDHLPNFTKSF